MAILLAGVGGVLLPVSSQSWAQSGDVVNIHITQGAISKTTNAYDPSPVEISVGDKVVWKNDDSTPHTATSGKPNQANGLFGGEAGGFGTIIAPGKTQEFTFTKAGEFSYYCALHPNMVGHITVVAEGSKPSQQPAQPEAGNASNQESTPANLEEARQLYMAAWNKTKFNATFSTFVDEGSATGYGIYQEHRTGTVFEPGEAIVLYAELEGFSHKRLATSDELPLYQMAFTANYTISGSAGNEIQRISNIPVGNITSHRQNTELFVLLSLSQDSPFPEGNYAITYAVKDSASGETFEMTKNVTIAAEPGT